jgi:hypothetical protein
MEEGKARVGGVEGELGGRETELILYVNISLWSEVWLCKHEALSSNASSTKENQTSINLCLRLHIKKSSETSRVSKTVEEDRMGLLAKNC